MIFSTPKRIFILCTVALIFATTSAQMSKGQLEKKEINQRIDDYLDLLSQGYSEIEIFQDLGNVNLLTENYEAAAFWYEKFLQANENKALEVAYNERYQYTLKKLGKSSTDEVRKDWFNDVASDYTATSITEANTIEDGGFAMNGESSPTMSVTSDGKVAYFSKTSDTKPLQGIFSKKETLHEIYRAEKVNGIWDNIKKVAVCPKYYSAKQPTVSADGSRLFFASNMPGTYGNYDIFVADIHKDGNIGKAKNLGPKVNTKKDDLHPNLVNGTLLFFASEGHKGYGGLDLYAVQVAKNRLSKSVNLGSPINSKSDEYSIVLVPEKGMGYVMSNRGKNNSLMKVAISYSKKHDGAQLVEKSEEGLMKVLNDDTTTDLSSTVFENE